MARRSVTELYQAARAAGLNPARAAIAAAIALAESSGDDKAVGDVSLQTNTWGPSVGAWQIRTIKSQTGTGSDRDISALQGNLPRQAQAMVNISGGGANWTPWTVYNTGKYQQYLNQANAAAGGDPTAAGGVPLTPQLVPVGLAADTADKARDLLLKLAFAGVGTVLVVVGLYKAVGGTAALKKAAKQTPGVNALVS